MSNTVNTNEQGLALQGYDPVSCFIDFPVVGNPEFHSIYEGITCYFANQENQAKFDATIT